ncbi:DapH/DapD/GlmU-related protein [Gracilimonas mengyeensis]|uniref:Acetyltransferase (Isoleucine patch superfamily) n=1 Tax=Gracilimonas mengyeensis TaxID=1302730 RepID=A0A521D0R4_9BACT|nr:DapH/DapD/GlmU-related protein [Gracilimonas mengyeensis]SMO65283.1 Acetyltransferase (isoleucine patch superfamily) [Gracilimonas mengyeensis]
MEKKKDIFERLTSGEVIPMDDPDYSNIREAVNQTMGLIRKLNASTDVNEARKWLGEVIGEEVDESTTLFPPFYTNVGKNIRLGKKVFINHACSFLDLGGITIEDEVMIGPRVNITSENHPVEVADRKTMVPGSVVIKRNAWIGGAASILPGITVGENSVVAAGAMVTKDVPANTVVAGVPAKVVKEL